MPSPGEYRRHLNRLYEQGRFQTALDEVVRAEGEGSAYHDEAIFWQACLLCKLGRPEEGMARLRFLSEHGGWVAREWLEWDPALEPLRGLEEFKALLPLMDSRRAQAEKETKVDVRVALPGGPSRRVSRPLLVLHGRGNEGEDALRRWGPAVHQGYAVFSLQSSQPWSPGLYQWDNEEMATHDVGRALEVIRRTGGVARRPPVLGGYSQGALVALRALLTGRAGGAKKAFLVSPSTRLAVDVGEETLNRVRASRLRGSDVVIVSGEKDFSLAFQLQLVEALTQAGARSRLEVVPGGQHDYPPDFSERLPVLLQGLDQP